MRLYTVLCIVHEAHAAHRTLVARSYGTACAGKFIWSRMCGVELVITLIMAWEIDAKLRYIKIVVTKKLGKD